VYFEKIRVNLFRHRIVPNPFELSESELAHYWDIALRIMDDEKPDK